MNEKVTDAQLFQTLRNLEAKGKIWSEIDKDGNLRFYTTEKPKARDHDRENITSLGDAARKRRMQNK
jgi:hypothetical protein